MTTSIGRFALASALALSLSLTAAHAQTSPAPAPLLTTVEQKLAAGPAGSRFGLLVTTLDGEVLLSVRRQDIWLNLRRKLAECGRRPGVDVKRRACGVASADVRLFVA